jgi:hypothetical protein
MKHFIDSLKRLLRKHICHTESSHYSKPKEEHKHHLNKLYVLSIRFKKSFQLKHFSDFIKIFFNELLMGRIC